MSLNVKNRRAHELAVELADLTGESLTATVILALEERLEKERRKKGSGAKAVKMLKFADRFAVGKPAGLTSGDHGSVLYGEDGLPR